MSKQIPRSKDTLPFPVLTLEEMLVFDGYLAYFESAANTAYQKMRKIPKEKRPEWYDKNVTYWKNVRSGFRHARGVTKRSMVKHGVKS